jgi:hypothetical protein
MDSVNQVMGLRVPRLDRVLDALTGRAVASPEPRARRRRRNAERVLPQLELRFLPTV